MECQRNVYKWIYESSQGGPPVSQRLAPCQEDRTDCLVLHSDHQKGLVRVREVELHVYLPNVALGETGDTVSILVQRKLPRGIREDRFVVTWSESWVHLNISQSIEDSDFWLRDGICVSAMIDGVSSVPEPWRFSENNTDDQAFVMVWSEEDMSVPQNMKTKRSHRARDRFRETAIIHSPFERSTKSSKFGGEKCKLEPLYINFRDLGWESWVIAPPGLEVGSCSGYCMREDISSNYNLLINNISRDPELYRLYGLAGIRTERTCVPTSFLPTVLMFIGKDQDIVVQLVDDILVGGCGCV
uniref:TGF-beta ligand n=1 Tax=Mnemiopsis leidyi TaxID=27923 RepID=G5CTL0_MNELE|nr:TGF-beta ligand [Mnemiopsis leidyi]